MKSRMLSLSPSAGSVQPFGVISSIVGSGCLQPEYIGEEIKAIVPSLINEVSFASIFSLSVKLLFSFSPARELREISRTVPISEPSLVTGAPTFRLFKSLNSAAMISDSVVAAAGVDELPIENVNKLSGLSCVRIVTSR